MPNIIVLLGCENGEDEELLDIAKSRANTAIKLLNDDPSLIVIPTGAFGDFNESNAPHGELLKKYLCDNGIDENRILRHTRTSNTVEDSYGVLKVVSSIPDIGKIWVVTSKFHMPRVKYIFGRVLQGYKLEYRFAPDPKATDTSRVEELRNEEPRKLKQLKEAWVDIANYDLKNFPAKCYENLGHELRHYDNLSYYALGGVAFLFSFILRHNILGESTPAELAQYFGGIFIIILLWHIYLRCANTAGAARRVMESIEQLYGVPGLSSTNSRTRIFMWDVKTKEAVDLIIFSMVVVLIIKALMTSMVDALIIIALIAPMVTVLIIKAINAIPIRKLREWGK